MPHADPAGFVFLGLSVAIIAALWLINEVATYIAADAREDAKTESCTSRITHGGNENQTPPPEEERKSIF